MGKAMARGLLALMFASFEAAAQFCPGLPPWVFDDVPSNHPFCTDITWMAQRGVTLGCAAIDPNHRLYCPADSVRRDQMAAFMHRLGDALFPLTCAAGQVMKWNGLAWACANDNLGGGGGGGTVTSVAASTGLQGAPNPITGAGTLSVAPSYRLPQACTTNQIAKWNGSTWICAADAAGAGTVTSLSQGSGIVLTPNPIVASGTIAADTAFLQRRVTGSCGAGSSIRTINADGSVVCEVDDDAGNAFVQGGNSFNAPAVLGTNNNQPLEIRVDGIAAMRYQPNPYSPNVIGGNLQNAVGPGLRGATIAGGGAVGDPNLVHSDWSTVGGGVRNEAGNPATPGAGEFATVGGGDDNVASGAWSTVGGGFRNVASGFSSAIAGGSVNTASGDYSTVAGGSSNWAGALHSVVMGFRGLVLPASQGSFVFADSTNADFASHASNEFLVAASGGIGLYTSKTGATYCRINPGGGSWNCSSAREVKRDFEPVDTRDALEKVASLSLSSWRFMNEPEGVRHLGPMAEDFRAAFGLGSDERSISSVDAQGVALAAIQGLNAKLTSKLARKAADIEAQADRIARLEARLAELESGQGRFDPARASASRVRR